MAIVNENFIAKPWVDAAREILASAKIKQTAVAAELGVSQVVVARFLIGARRPSSASVRRINCAVAVLANHPPIEAYLDLEALACGLLQTEHFGAEALTKGAFRILRWYAYFFKPGAFERIAEFLRASGEPAVRTLIADLSRALHRILVAELLPTSTPVGFTAVYEALERSGIEIEQIVSERSAPVLAAERFRWTVLRELAAANPHAPASDRLAAVQRIFEPFHDPDAAAHLLKGLAPVISIERPQSTW